MNNRFYSTDQVYDGPWLLDANALKELDSIVLRHYKILEARRNQLLESEVEKESARLNREIDVTQKSRDQYITSYRNAHSVYSKSYMYLNVFYRNFSVRRESFALVIRDRSLQDELAEGFKFDFRSGDITGEITIDKTDGLKIELSPEDLDECQEIFVDLDAWATSHKARFLQRLSWRIAKLGFLPYIVTSLVLGLLFAFISFTRSGDLLVTQEKMHGLLNQGISSSNLVEAVTLLLQIQILENSPVQVPSWYRTILLLGAFFFVVLLIQPKIVLGLGRGVTQLRFWKMWQTFIIVTVPTLILGKFIYPFVLGIIERFIDAP